jgi:4-amino-4-deoxy-L-arabinose transferase-like glycosyltransferase
VWGLYQNLWNLGAANLHPDESIYARAGLAYLHGDFKENLEHPFVAKYLQGLAQIALGEGIVSARAAAGLASVLTAVFLWWWLRSAAGRAAGLIAAALWVLLPSQVSVFWGPRVDRFALLEPFMVMFGVLAAAAGWRWLTTGRTGWMILSAVAIGAGVTSKVTIGVIAPVLVLAPLLARRDRKTVFQAVAFAVTALAVIVLTYVPSGDVIGTIQEMLDYQSRHAHNGHVVAVGSMVTAFTPWWTNLYWLAQGIGVLSCLGVAMGIVLLPIFGRTAVAAFVAANLAMVSVFLLWFSPVALAHYYSALLPWLYALAAIGLTSPWRAGQLGQRSVGITASARTAALAAGVALLVAAGATSAAVAAEHPWGPARVTAALRDAGRSGGPVLFTGFNPWEYKPYVTDTVQSYKPSVVAIAVYRGWVRNPPDPAILRLVDDHPGYFDRVQLDQLELDIVRRPLPP